VPLCYLKKMMKSKSGFIIKYAMFIWVALIWVLSSLPAESLPKMDTLNLDKAAHIFVYLVLSIIVMLNYRRGTFGRFSREEVIMFVFVMAALDESHQLLIVNRNVSLYDLAANMTGVTLGYFLTKRLTRTV
jgi:VanZ family protein